MWREQFRKKLIEEFQAKKTRNQRYSLRSFAKASGISIGALSELLRSQTGWNISPERALNIFERLAIPTDYLKALMGLPLHRTKTEISEQNYFTLTQWMYYPILMAFDLAPDFTEPEAIAARLGLQTSKVSEVIADLLAQGLLEKTPNGLRRKETYWETSPAVPTPIVRQHHRDNLNLSIRALEEIPPAEREISSLTFVGSKSQFELLRQEIMAFQDRLMALMTPEQSDEVYRMSVQLFPVNFAKRT